MKTAFRIENEAALEKLCERRGISKPGIELPAFMVLDASPPVVIEAEKFLALYEPTSDNNPGTYRERHAARRSSRGRLPSGPPQGRTQEVHPESDDPRSPVRAATRDTA